MNFDSVKTIASTRIPICPRDVRLSLIC